MTALASSQPAPRFSNLRAALALARQQRRQVEEADEPYDPGLVSDFERLCALESLLKKVLDRGPRVDLDPRFLQSSSALRGYDPAAVSNAERLEAIKAIIRKVMNGGVPDEVEVARRVIRLLTHAGSSGQMAA